MNQKERARSVARDMGRVYTTEYTTEELFERYDRADSWLALTIAVTALIVMLAAVWL